MTSIASAVAMRDRSGEQAGEGESTEDLRHRPDQHRRVEPDGDDLALVRQQNPVNCRRHRLVRYDPNTHGCPLDRGDEMRESCRGGGEKRSDVVHQVRGGFRLLDDPPYDERNGRICEDRLEFHCRLPGSADFSTLLIFLYLNPKTGLDGVHADGPGDARPTGSSMPGTWRRYACA